MVNAETLDGLVTEIEHVFDERKISAQAAKGIYERCKAAGYVPAFVRQMARERQMAAEDRAAKYQIEHEYRASLGMRLGDYVDTPLGEAAMGRAHDDLEGHANGAEKPKPFAEQPVHEPKRRGRKPPVLFDADHPLGTA